MSTQFMMNARLDREGQADSSRLGRWTEREGMVAENGQFRVMDYKLCKLPNTEGLYLRSLSSSFYKYKTRSAFATSRIRKLLTCE